MFSIGDEIKCSCQEAGPCGVTFIIGKISENTKTYYADHLDIKFEHAILIKRKIIKDISDLQF